MAAEADPLSGGAGAVRPGGGDAGLERWAGDAVRMITAGTIAATMTAHSIRIIVMSAQLLTAAPQMMRVLADPRSRSFSVPPPPSADAASAAGCSHAAAAAVAVRGVRGGVLRAAPLLTEAPSSAADRC